MATQKFFVKNNQILDAQRRNENKRTRRTVFYVALFVVVSLVFLFVCAAVFLKVNEIQIKGNERYSNKEIRELVPITEGDNIFLFDSDEIEAAILQKYPYVGKVEVTRDFPTTVVVNITEEVPYFVAHVAGDTFYISENLKILEKLNGEVDNNELTELNLNNVRRCIVGEDIVFVDNRTFDAINELQLLFKTNYIEEKILSIDVRSRFDIYLNYDDRFRIYFGDMENADVKIRFLIGA